MQRLKLQVCNALQYKQELLYSVYSIDITNKQVNTPKQDKIGHYQSQNCNTFLQTISLRTQPNIIETKFIGNKD